MRSGIRGIKQDGLAKIIFRLVAQAATPGADFDTQRGNGYVRFCFAGTTADMGEAMDLLATWLS